MTVKQFFKSTSFKCIAALLCILLLCGVFLTIAYGFLEVTDEERFQRAINKIYGKNVTTEEVDLSEKNTNLSASTIQNLYLVKDDGNYLVKSAGKNGFGGSVVCWVVIITNDDGNAVSGVGAVTIDSAPGESYIGYISDENLSQFSKDYKDGIVYDYGYKNEGTKVPGDMYINTGASFSYRAICNAVNGAIDFVKAYLSGTEIVDPYKEYRYREYIDMDSTIWTTDSGKVSYTVYAGGYGRPGSFTIQIVVDANATITEYTIITNGSTADRYLNAMPDDVKDGTRFIGKTLSFFTGVYGEDMAYTTNNPEITTGATASQSIYLCYYAGAFATANYETCLANPKEGGDAE